MAAAFAGYAADGAAHDLASPAGPGGTRHPDPAVRRAMALLPAGVSTPVEVVDIGRFSRSLRVRLERSCAFVFAGVERIYINEACPIYLAAEGSVLDTLKLAALLSHEQAHLRGADEADARAIEAATFRALLRMATAEYQTPGMLYVTSLEQLARRLKGHRRPTAVARGATEPPGPGPSRSSPPANTPRAGARRTVQ